MSTAYKCRTCGTEGEEHFYKSAKYQCKTCWNKRTSDTQRNKVKAIKEHYGGKCVICGYNKYWGALDFHHPDPSIKEYSLGEARGRSFDTLKKELDKCMLVCRNCHAELHAT